MTFKIFLFLIGLSFLTNGCTSSATIDPEPEVYTRVKDQKIWSFFARELQGAAAGAE